MRIESQADIIITNSDNEYLVVVEIKRAGYASKDSKELAIQQLKKTMASVNCSLGILVYGEEFLLLRDSFEEFNGESISIVGEARLQLSTLPPASGIWANSPHFEFEERVQRWFESFRFPSERNKLSDELKGLLREPILSLIQSGDIRTVGPRARLVASDI